MIKKVLKFGVISGLIVSTIMAVSMFIYSRSDSGHGSGGMIIGYASMLLAFSFIFVGIKQFRDKNNGGVITFGKAWVIGLLIAFVASTFYVVTWMIEYYNFMPDFMDKYAESMIKHAQEAGASADEMSKQMADIQWMKDVYKNPLGVMAFTYFEILPPGIVVSLICALILKRKVKKETAVIA
jgi:hypothetical protein